MINREMIDDRERENLSLNLPVASFLSSLNLSSLLPFFLFVSISVSVFPLLSPSVSLPPLYPPDCFSLSLSLTPSPSSIHGPNASALSRVLGKQK